MWRSLFFCVSVGFQIHLFIMAELTLRRLSGEHLSLPEWRWLKMKNFVAHCNSSSPASKRLKSSSRLSCKVFLTFSRFSGIVDWARTSSKARKGLKVKLEIAERWWKILSLKIPPEKSFSTLKPQPGSRWGDGKFSVPNKRELLLLGQKGESRVKFSKTFTRKSLTIIYCVYGIMRKEYFRALFLSRCVVYGVWRPRTKIYCTLVSKYVVCLFIDIVKASSFLCILM